MEKVGRKNSKKKRRQNAHRGTAFAVSSSSTDDENKSIRNVKTKRTTQNEKNDTCAHHMDMNMCDLFIEFHTTRAHAHHTLVRERKREQSRGRPAALAPLFH